MAPKARSHGSSVGGHSPADIMHQLKGIDFPAQKPDLIEHAKSNHASKEVLDELSAFEDREYDTMADVLKAYGKAHH